MALLSFCGHVVVEVDVLLCDASVVVVPPDVFDALLLQLRDAFWVEDELFELVIDTFEGWLHVDDGV